MLNQIASTSSTSSEKLPTYEELRAERTLKETFGKLVVDHEEIQKLFVSVAGELESTQKIGESHPLCKEWNDLRKVLTVDILLTSKSNPFLAT